MRIHERLKQLRKAKNWSQKDLADKIGMNDYQQISRYEQGKIIPSLEAVIKIAKALEVSVDELLGEPGFSQTPSENNEVLKDYLEQIQNLDEEDQKMIKHMIDALIKKNKMKQVLEEK